MRDAAVAEPGEVSTTLEPILEHNPRLVWTGEAGRRRVLVVTWTSYTGYNDKIGQATGLTREVWVTAAPLVKDFCRAHKLAGAAAVLRLEQLLGLPAKSGKDRFVELWVDPADLFRPCPDPEISDRECGLDFPQPSRLVAIHEAHVRWYNDLKASSYGEGGYPWTRLGYTYDWGGPKQGLSEFVIRKDASVTVHAVGSTAEYCK